MMMRWDRIQSATFTAATIAVAATLVHREFFSSESSGRGAMTQQITKVADWRSLVALGRTVGDSAAPVKVIEFFDLECPFCKSFNERMEGVSARYHGRVAAVYVHFPLPMHAHARLAARAAECANSQSHFSEMVDTLYGDQKSLGVRSWGAYASAAGVPDAAAFQRCMADTLTRPSVAAGMAAGHKLNVFATPTILINESRFSIPPSDDDLKKVIDKDLAQKR